MENAMAELPLAIFTTLVPFGAGAFIMLATSLFVSELETAEQAKLDRLSIVPLAIVAVGFVASFFHLASPMAAFGVFAGLGSSPLSNEIVAGIAFFVVAAVYCAMAFAGRLSEPVRKPFAVAVGILALVFSVFTGMAYMMETIASWNTPLVPIEMVGFALLGGAALGSVLISASVDARSSHRWAPVAFVMALVGYVAALVALVGHYGVLGALSSSTVAGATLADGVTAFLAGFAACGLLAVVSLGIGCKKPSLTTSALAALLALAAIFLVRFAFYAIQLSVAL